MATNEQMRQLQTAIALQRTGRLADAVALCDRLVREAPNSFECVYLLGMLYAQQQQLSAAIAMLRRAVKIRPDVLDVRYNLAVALSMSGNHEEAAPNYKRILEENPRHAGARLNYATTLLQIGRTTEALDHYNELIALNPDLADAYSNRGMALQNLKRFSDALSDFDKAVALKPNFPEAYVNRGNVLAALHRSDDALASYNKAIALSPNFADAYNNAGNISYHRGSYEDALNAYDKALSISAGDSEARSMRLSAKLHLCDWSDFDTERADFIACVRQGALIYPFISLAVSSSPDEQLQCARTFSKTRYPLSDKPLWRDKVYSHDRIRVAYLSADFREHPVAYLIAGLFEQHDKSRFETTGLSFARDQDSPTGLRIKGAFERFVDVRQKSDRDTAELIRSLEIDIAVDLMGYTTGNRASVFAHRPAPIQVNYLGYPGTMGSDYVDYILADPTVIPEQDSRFYREQVLWLPRCYQVNDNRRAIAEHTPIRRDCGLPDNGFVFCCFNSTYKITPEIFDIWMRLLKAVDGSVLWLLEGAPTTAANLRREAEKRGVPADRLIFAPKTGLADHLARHRLADLFLDTLPYNAHTTASDALWAGLPLLTLLGTSFAGRVAASLLKATGLDELITRSPEEYESLALKLARDPALLASLKEKLAHNRNKCSLFDTQGSARDIEAAYTLMWRRYQSGEPVRGTAKQPLPKPLAP
jgi:protein O-GlcNAc transferase